MNRGLQECRGKYVAILDQDDQWIHADKLSQQVDFLETHTEYGIVGTQREIALEEQKKIRFSRLPASDQEIREYISRGCPFVHSTILCPKQVLESVEGYAEKYRYSMDYDLFYKILSQFKGRNMDMVSTTYNIHATNTSGLHFRASREEALDIIQQYQKDFPVDPFYFKLQQTHARLGGYFSKYRRYEQLKNGIKNAVT